MDAHLTLDVIALRDDHLAQAVALSSGPGWPYRDADWRFAYALGSGVAIEAEARVVGTALWWPYGETHASFGMIIVAQRDAGARLGTSPDGRTACTRREAGPSP